MEVRHVRSLLQEQNMATFFNLKLFNRKTVEEYRRIEFDRRALVNGTNKQYLQFLV